MSQLLLSTAVSEDDTDDEETNGVTVVFGNSWEFIWRDMVMRSFESENDRDIIVDKSLLTSSIVLLASTGAFIMEEKANCCITPEMVAESWMIALAVVLLVKAMVYMFESNPV